jgi:hypothetical protein
MTRTMSPRRPPTATRLLFATLAFVAALSGLAGAHATMLTPAASALNTAATGMTPADLVDGPIAPERDDACPEGCALHVECTIWFSTASTATTTHPTPSTGIARATIPQSLHPIAGILPDVRPPSLTALSISRI